MSQKFQFSIVTPERVTYQSEAVSVTVPTQAGEVTVLHKHTPIVSTLQPGGLTVRKEDGAELLLAVSGGLLEVRRNGEVVILADTAERAGDIDIERAEAARKRAQEAMERKEFDKDIQHAELEATLQKELARIKVATIQKHARRA